ncbi:unnamed protein product [Aureobasidium vineae]|uniref:DNA-binding protein RAP1 n=1 Tax=Aureobasidium vineae TaxID=2773715 RepID=A0A9N8JGP6_9PEZI|nr:unnamed protein product [Aureobasidium vineae]
MPLAIVYSDMADSVDVQGCVFGGNKFFIVQRVPQRSHYISLVESNGGRVVKLEAQADYLIADHMRHDAPAGSLSYKFLEEAIKQGQIPEDDSPFLAGRRKSANPVTTAAGPSKKSTRTPFTDDDDKLLYKWVNKADQEGLAIQGNTLYKVLAEHNPRHTYHSWRDRYVKVLSTRPPTGWKTYPDENLPTIDTPIADLPSTALPRSTAVRRSVTRSPSKPRVYIPFTQEDDEVLEAFVAMQARKGASLSGNAIYKELEARNPRHSYHSWRDRWIRHLSLREPLDEEEDDGPFEDNAIPDGENHISARLDPSPESPISKPPLKRSSFRIPPGASASVENSKNTTPRSGVTRPIVALKEKASKSTPQASIRDRAASQKEPVADPEPLTTASRPTISYPTTSRPAATSKNQANTPMARTRNVSSPVMSQQTSAQPHSLHTQPSTQVEAQGSREILRHRAVQADLEPQFHDDSTFTQEDYDNLLDAALDIQNVRVGRYQESWISWADFKKSHTAVEWRSFYERRVLPVVLQEEDDFELLETHGGGAWAEFWRNQGQPVTTLPHLKQDGVPERQPAPARSAEAAEESTPRVSRTESAKQNEEVDDVADPFIKVERTTATVSAKRKQQARESSVKEEPAPKRRRTATPPTAPHKSPTPVQTVPRPNADDVVSISSKVAPPLSHHSDEEEEVPEDQAAEQLRREMVENRDIRHQLTRANLARIQAETGLAEKKAVDIEQDNENDDQPGFADYLASMLPQGMKDKILQTSETHDHQLNQDDEIDEDDEDTVMHNNQQDQREYDPALLEIDPNLDNPSYNSSAEYRANNPSIHLDAPQTQPWEVSSALSASQQRNQRLSTQAIYEAETQSFDAEIPLPPLDLGVQTQHYAVANTDSQILSAGEMWPWIDAQISAGYTEDAVIAALRKTSFNPKLAVMVLEAGEEEADVAGVWTEEEDIIVEGSDARAIRRLEVKHGKGSAMARLKFLSDWRRDKEIAEMGEEEAD